jgi:hypothetical protein
MQVRQQLSGSRVSDHPARLCATCRPLNSRRATMLPGRPVPAPSIGPSEADWWSAPANSRHRHQPAERSPAGDTRGSRLAQLSPSFKAPVGRAARLRDTCRSCHLVSAWMVRLFRDPSSGRALKPAIEPERCSLRRSAPADRRSCWRPTRPRHKLCDGMVLARSLSRPTKASCGPGPKLL